MDKKYIKLIGNVASGLALAFLVYKLFHMDIRSTQLNSLDAVFIIFIGTMLWTVINVVSCFPWIQYIKVFCNKDIDKKKAQIIYLKANILKYLPGNVFQYIGRNEYAIEENCNHVDVATATVAEQVSSAIVLAVYSVVLVNKKMRAFLPSKGLLFLVITVITITLVILYFATKKWRRLYQFCQNILNKLYSSEGRNRTAAVFVFYLLIDLVGPLLYYIILKRLFNVDISIRNFFPLAGIYLFSVLVGFLTPGAPGGIGVREVVMVSLSGGIINEETVLIIALMFRVITISADFVSYIYALIAEALQKRNRP